MADRLLKGGREVELAIKRPIGCILPIRHGVRVKGRYITGHCAPTAMLPPLHRLSISAKSDPAPDRPTLVTYDERGISQADAKGWWDRGQKLGRGNFGEVRDVPFLRLRESSSDTTGKRVVIKQSRFDKMEANASERDEGNIKEQMFQNQRVATREYWAHMDIWNRMKEAGTQRFITQPIPMQAPCKDDDLDLNDDEMVDAPQFIGANGSTDKRSRAPSPSPTTPSPSPPSTTPTLFLSSDLFDSDSDTEPSPSNPPAAKRSRNPQKGFKTKHYPCTIDRVTNFPIEHLYTIQAWACDEDSTLHTMADFFKTEANFDKLKTVATEVGRALHALHDTRYSHGDLSPNNIIVCAKQDGDDVTIKLIDFGLSYEMSERDLALDGEFVNNKFGRLNERFRASSSFDKANPVDFYSCVRQAYKEAATSTAR